MDRRFCLGMGPLDPITQEMVGDRRRATVAGNEQSLPVSANIKNRRDRVIERLPTDRQQSSLQALGIGFDMAFDREQREFLVAFARICWERHGASSGGQLEVKA